MRRLNLLAPDRGNGVATADVQMRAGMPIVLVSRFLVPKGLGGHSRQVRAGFLEIVILVGIGSRPHRTGRDPFGDVFDVAPRTAPLEMIGHRFVAGGRLQLAHRVGENQLVLAVAMLEEIHHAFVLEQTLHEIEIGLVILNAVFARRIGSLQPLLEFYRTVFGEDLLDDLDGAHVLENAAVGGVAEKPEPRPDNRLVMGQPILDPGEAEFRNEAAEPAFRISGFTFDGDGTAQHLQRIDIRSAADKAHRIGEATAHLIAPDKVRESQHPGAKWCLDGCRTIGGHWWDVPLQ